MSKKEPLKKTHPGIAAQWHKKFNGEKKPENFTSGQNEKIWWKCPKEEDHVWYQTIKSRNAFKNKIIKEGAGCPMCSGKIVVPSNSLAVKHPMIAKQWHKSLNGDKKPENFTSGNSKDLIHWQCHVEKDHVWPALIKSRTNGDRCPCCSTRNKKVVPSNCLATTHQYLTKEWHPTENGKKKPENFTSGQNEKIWWKCSYDDRHIWPAFIKDRARKKNPTGCPKCSTKTSFEELKIFYEIRSIFKKTESEYKKEINGKKWTFDFFIPELTLVIDYDGNYWHSVEEQNNRDKIKTKAFTDNKYEAFRIREQTDENLLEEITPNDIIFHKKQKNIKLIVNKILEKIIHIYGNEGLKKCYPQDKKILEKIKLYLKEKNLQNSDEFENIYLKDI